MDVLRSALEGFGRRAPVGLEAHGEMPKAEIKLREIERETGKRPEGRLPDFLLLGAQKCGTSYLFKRLSRHPDVEPAVVKEVDFFSKHFGWGVGWYRSCFPARAGGKPSRSWEASPNNLLNRGTPTDPWTRPQGSGSKSISIPTTGDFTGAWAGISAGSTPRPTAAIATFHLLGD